MTAADQPHLAARRAGLTGEQYTEWLTVTLRAMLAGQLDDEEPSRGASTQAPGG